MAPILADDESEEAKEAAASEGFAVELEGDDESVAEPVNVEADVEVVSL